MEFPLIFTAVACCKACMNTAVRASDIVSRMQPSDSSSKMLTLEQLHNRFSFQLALALYHEATGTRVLTGVLQESPEYHTGNQFFSLTEFLSPKAAKTSPEAFQERCKSLQRASEVLKKAQRDVGSENCSKGGSLSDAAIIDARGRCSLAVGRAQQALMWHQEAQQLRQALLPEGHILLGHSCFNCGLALAALGVRLLCTTFSVFHWPLLCHIHCLSSA
jgi:hypothetical protein